MIIGNLTYDRARDTYTGELATLTVAARKVVFLKLPRFRGVELDLGDYGSVVTASIAAS